MLEPLWMLGGALLGGSVMWVIHQRTSRPSPKTLKHLYETQLKYSEIRGRIHLDPGALIPLGNMVEHMGLSAFHLQHTTTGEEMQHLARMVKKRRNGNLDEEDLQKASQILKREINQDNFLTYLFCYLEGVSIPSFQQSQFWEGPALQGTRESIQMLYQPPSRHN